jgi:hypothetical protein
MAAPNIIRMGLLKRNGIHVYNASTALEAVTFQFDQIQDAHLAYYYPSYNYDISTQNPAGGIYAINDPNVPQGATQGLDFSLGQGSNLRQTRYFAPTSSVITGAGSNAGGWTDAQASTNGVFTLAPLSPYTLIG